MDSAQTSFLRGVFLSLSTRPADQSHVQAFVRAHYRDIPVEARGALGQGVLQMFQTDERPAAAASNSAAGASEPAQAQAAQQQPQQPRTAPRITWKSFQRVCAAIGLQLNERRGLASIRKFASEEPPPALVSAAAGGGAAPFEPGMTFDDFMVFYASLSKPLSVTQEMAEVWRLLDEDLDGMVPLAQLRAVMIGLERIAPSNTVEHSSAFYDSNYRYHFTDAQKKLTSEQLVDQMITAHFTHKNVETDKITFQEFVEFMYA